MSPLPAYFYVILWLEVATEPETCWAIWTQMTYSTHGCTDTQIYHPNTHEDRTRNTCTDQHAYIHCHTVTAVMDQSELKLS